MFNLNVFTTDDVVSDAMGPIAYLLEGTATTFVLLGLLYKYILYLGLLYKYILYLVGLLYEYIMYFEGLLYEFILCFVGLLLKYI